MLIVDPVKRITIPEIRQHRWFQTHLPRYLAVSPPDTVEQAKKVGFSAIWRLIEFTCCDSNNISYVLQINEEIVQEVVNMGFDRNQVLESLRNRTQNDVCSFLSLMLLIPETSFQ